MIDGCAADVSRRQELADQSRSFSFKNNRLSDSDAVKRLTVSRQASPIQYHIHTEIPTFGIIRTVIPTKAQEQLLSLDECRSLLLSELGDSTPALVTLKRWSQGGLLDCAKRIPDKGRRVRFHYQDLAARVRELSRSRIAPQDAPPPSIHTATQVEQVLVHNASELRASHRAAERVAAPDAEVEEFSAKVQARLGPDLAEALRPVLDDVLRPLLSEALAATQKQLTDGLANIRSIERSLMLRFDNENQLLRNKVAELKQENDRLRQQSNPIDMVRLQMTLTRLTEQIDALKREGS